MPATATVTASMSRSTWGGARKGAGKKRGTKHTATPKIGRKLYLSVWQWDYLACWHVEGSNSSEQLDALLTRAMRFWPGGPRTCAAMKPDVIERNRQPLPRPESLEAPETPALGGWIGRKVYLTAAQWAYLESWGYTGENASAQVRALLDRADRLWPAGPFTNPRMNMHQLEQHAGA